MLRLLPRRACCNAVPACIRAVGASSGLVDATEADRLLLQESGESPFSCVSGVSFQLSLTS
jgi:hypothetical protein